MYIADLSVTLALAPKPNDQNRNTISPLRGLTENKNIMVVAPDNVIALSYT